MSKFSLSVYLNAYSDQRPSNNPDQNNFKWNRDLSSIFVNNPTNQSNTLAPGETRSFFSGVRTLAQDNTTQYSIALKPLSSNTWVLSAVGGALPNFRAPRTTGADNTTQVTVAVNGPVVTFTSTGGTPFNLVTGGVVVGDYAAITADFNPLNQGTFKVLSVSATSFSVEILTGTNEGPITLSSANSIQIFSAAGVQVGDTLVIPGGFSPVTQGSYDVTAVYANSLEFSFTGALPTEGPITTQVTVYSNAKQLVYLESDSPVHVILNGVDSGVIEPFLISNAAQPSLPPQAVPGVYMLKSTIWSLSVSNLGTDPANVYFAAIE